MEIAALVINISETILWRYYTLWKSNRKKKWL